MSICSSSAVGSGVSSSSSRSSRAATAAVTRGFHSTSPKATTILCVRKNGQVCMMGDGMVSQGSLIVKSNTNKIRSIKDDTLVGFAGSTADAFTLLDRLEGKLDEYPGQLTRASVELAKGWRTDKYLRRLEASIVVADAHVSLEVTGNGDVLESTDGILGVGSGSPYAIGTCHFLLERRKMMIVLYKSFANYYAYARTHTHTQRNLIIYICSFPSTTTNETQLLYRISLERIAAARALKDIDELSAEDVCKKAMRIASDMCVHTNDNYVTKIIEGVKEGEEKKE